MTLPRQVLSGRFYLVTRRCTQRQFLLRPDAATNNAFVYCLAVAARRFEIDVVLPCAMSNHGHTVFYDRHGNYPAFIEHFHKLLARSQNALRGRWENMWSSEQACVVRLVDREDVLRKLVYVATNPVKDHLVERAHQWPGVNGLVALLGRRVLHATRPLHFFRKDGPLPKEIELRLEIPPELGDAAEILQELADRVRAFEAAAAVERTRTGRRVLGRRAVLEQDWRLAPDTIEPRRVLRPQIAAKSPWSRVEALLRNREFLHAYRDARQAWIDGYQCVFPKGTWWLRKFARVPIAEG